MQDPRNRKLTPSWKIVRRAGGLLVLLFACFQLGGYMQVRNQAWTAYIASRDGIPTDSPLFETRGVYNSMSEDEVEERMHGAKKALRRMPSEQPVWDGFVNIYEFDYGPRYGAFLQSNAEPLMRELFWVYFSPDGHAQNMNVSLIQRYKGSTSAAVDPLPKKDSGVATSTAG